MTSAQKKSALPPLPDDVLEDDRHQQYISLMPRELIEEFGAFIFEHSDDETKVAAVDPGNNDLRRFVAQRFGETIIWHTATADHIAIILRGYPTDFAADINRMTGAAGAVNGNIIALVDKIINYAVTEKASDIHIEPGKGETVVRFRIDGVLHAMSTLPSDFHGPVVARLKLLANLKIDEFRHPQDGRIELEDPMDVSLRVSMLPTLHGEKVVMRILDDTNKDLEIKRLGFNDKHIEILERNAEKPFGMIVASGPTGSGKTTTLYGLLHSIRREGINISTLEDPIEYSLEGINQVQINPRINFTFASGLRSLLRQDPDVMMVGEIRDSETAVMAADAALTGHLVLTTLHTNDAPSTFTRLLEMNVEEFAVGSIVNLVIAQRLVRSVCSHCATTATLDDAVINKIKERDDIVAVLKDHDINTTDLKKKKFAAGKGCEHCLESGYLGRTGMFEMLETSKIIHDIILEDPSVDRIREAGAKKGFQPMIVDGVEKVLDGTTTFSEVLRTTKDISP